MEKTELEFAELKFIPQNYDDELTGDTIDVASSLERGRKELEENLKFLAAYMELMNMYMSLIKKNMREFLDRDSTDEPIEITEKKTSSIEAMTSGELYFTFRDLENSAAKLAVFIEEQTYDFPHNMYEVYELRSEINKKLKDEKNMIADKYYEIQQSSLYKNRREFNEVEEYIGLPKEEIERREKAAQADYENRKRANEQKRKERQLALQNPNGLKKPNYLTKDDMQKWLSENPDATEYVVPEGIAVIGEYAFDGLEKLVKVTLPQSLVVISRAAFNACVNLRNITVPKNVKLICDGAFSRCYSLESVTIEGTTMPQIETLVFMYSEAMKKIIVPADSVNSYTEDFYWRQYVSKND